MVQLSFAMSDDLLSIFISHRHDDAAIATIVSEEFEKWRLTRRVFQSSRKTSGLNFGDKIQLELATKLRMVDFFFLIYTSDDEDWTYPAWEHGVATGANGKETRIVVLQCGEDQPKFGGDTRYLRIEPDDIAKFVRDMHKSAEFLVPDEATRAAEKKLLDDLAETKDSEIDAHATRLYERLQPFAAMVRPATDHRWQFLQLGLEAEQVSEIEAMGTDEEEEWRSRIADAASVLAVGQRTPLHHFDMTGDGVGESLADIFERWAEGMRALDGSAPPDTAWCDRLVADIYLAIKRRNPQVSYARFRSLADHDLERHFRPLLLRADTYRDGSMSYDVYFYRLPEGD